MLKFSMVLVLVSLFSTPSLAQSVAELEKEYARLETESMACAIAVEKDAAEGALPRAKNKTSQEIKARALNRLNGLHCTADRYHALRREMARIAQMNSAFPYLYSSTITEERIENREGDTRQEFLAPLVRPFFDGTRRFPKCNHRISANQLVSDQFLHGYLLEYGYSCTARAFKAASLQMGDSRQAQQAIDRAFSKEDNQPNLNGLTIALVPHLSYERSALNHVPGLGFLGGEKLVYFFLKKRLEDLGAQVEIIYRNSTADIQTQAQQTYEGLQRLSRTAGPMVIMTRSFGAGVINYLFNGSGINTASLIPNIISWINIGGTPNGSVIAEYKSREDQYYLRTLRDGLKTFNGLNRVARFYVNLMVSLNYAATEDDIERFIQFGVNGLNPELTKTMSHLNPEFQAIAKRGPRSDFKNQVKVFNVIYLIDDIMERTESHDPVLQNMLAYGPTEGSAPLWGAAIDTNRSARVFLDRDHLAFRGIRRVEAEDMILKIFSAAQDAGYLNQ